MCVIKFDNWMWRGNQEAVCCDHIKRPYFISPNSIRVVGFRAFVAFSYIGVALLHLVATKLECFMFVTNWNMLLTTMTFSLLFIASCKDKCN